MILCLRHKILCILGKRVIDMKLFDYDDTDINSIYSYAKNWKE